MTDIKMADVRQSNFELLRIVSTIMITLHHISMTFGLDNSNWYIRLWAQFFYIGGKAGVNCFVMLSAYFLVEKNFKISRVIKIYFQILFYCIFLFLIGILIHLPFERQAYFKTFLPIIFNHYWFVTSYMGLLFLAPFINLLISKLKFRQHTFLLIVGGGLFCLIPTLTTQTPFNDNLSWFCFLYCIAGYFKKYQTKVKKILSKPIVFVVMWIGIWITSVIMMLLTERIPVFAEGINFFSGMYIIPEVINSISIFLFFEKLQLSSKMVNEFGKITFSCYLIFSNYVMIPIRISLLNYVFLHTSKWLYPMTACLMAVFLLYVGMLTEFVREHLFYFLGINKLITTLSSTFNRILEKSRKWLENYDA